MNRSSLRAGPALAGAFWTARTLIIAWIVVLALIRSADSWQVNRLALRAINRQDLAALVAGDSARPRHQAMAALAYWQLGQRTEAIDTLSSLSSDNSPRHELWQFQLGTMLLHKGASAQAVQVWQDSQVTDVVISYCESAIRQRARESADLWCPPLSHLGEDPRAQCAHASYNQWAGDLERSLQGFRNAQKHSRSLSATCMHDYATTLHRLGNHEEALARYQAAFEADPDPRHLRAAGHVLMQMDDYDRAIHTLSQAYTMSQSNRDRSESARLLGFAHYRLGDFKAAHSRLEEAVSCYQGADPSAYLYLARTERKLGHPDTAARIYRQAVARLGPNRDLIWYRYELAELLTDLGEGEQAAEVYRGILEVCPDDAIALEALLEFELEGEP